MKSLEELKTSLARKVQASEDEPLLMYIKAVLDGETDAWFEGLPEKAKEFIKIWAPHLEPLTKLPHDSEYQAYRMWLSSRTA